MSDLTSVPDIIRYVESRGYRTQRVFNDVDMQQNGAELRVAGLRLLGPRGNKGFVSVQNGFGGLDMVRLWCDMVDYGTAAVAEKRARAAQARG